MQLVAIKETMCNQLRSTLLVKTKPFWRTYTAYVLFNLIATYIATYVKCIPLVHIRMNMCDSKIIMIFASKLD